MSDQRPTLSSLIQYFSSKAETAFAAPSDVEKWLTDNHHNLEDIATGTAPEQLCDDLDQDLQSRAAARRRQR